MAMDEDIDGYALIPLAGPEGEAFSKALATMKGKALWAIPRPPSQDLAIAGHLPDVALGETVSYQYDMHGGSAPRRASITAGALPTGLSLDEHAAVTGAPTAVGKYSWTITATDGKGSTATLSDSTNVVTYLTSLLYPVMFSEQASSSLVLASGSLHKAYEAYTYVERSSSSLSLTSGSLHDLLESYSYAEQATSSLALTSGSLETTLLGYSYAEQTASSLALTSGTLETTLITTALTEQATSSLVLASGTLQ